MNEVTGEEVGMERAAGCIFCSIAQKQTSAEVVYESDNAIFFHDISPKATVHVVGIPKKHIVSIGKITEEDL